MRTVHLLGDRFRYGQALQMSAHSKCSRQSHHANHAALGRIVVIRKLLNVNVGRKAKRSWFPIILCVTGWRVREDDGKHPDSYFHGLVGLCMSRGLSVG